MAKKENPEPQPFETVEPIGKRVLIRKDEDKKETKGGIKLPDNIEIPTITGRIVAVSAEIENMPEIPLSQYDKVLFNPKGVSPSISRATIDSSSSKWRMSSRCFERPELRANRADGAARISRYCR